MMATLEQQKTQSKPRGKAVLNRGKIGSEFVTIGRCTRLIDALPTEQEKQRVVNYLYNRWGSFNP